MFVSRPDGGLPSPDANVNNTEGIIEKALAKKPSSQRRAEFPERPGFGTRGRQVLLLANYFRLSASQLGTLSRYNLEILPDAAGRRPNGRKAKQIIKLLLDLEFRENKNKIATDYKSMLVSAGDIGLPLNQEKQYSVQYRAEGEEDIEPLDPKIYRIRLQKTGEFSVSDLLNYLNSTDANAVLLSKEEIITALNIVVGHWPKTNPDLVTVGSNKHIGISQALIERGPISAGLEVLRGFFISVRPATTRLLLNVQVKNIACYQSGPLENVLKAFGNEHRWQFSKIASFIKNLRVETTHLIKKNKQGQKIPRIKVISDIARKTRQNQDGRVRVSRDGAGPEEVEFLLDEPVNTPKGKGKERAGKSQGPSSRWITVAKFFKESKATLSRLYFFQSELLISF